MPRVLLLAILVPLLAGCESVPKPHAPVACPTLTSWSPEDMDALAAELEDSPPPMLARSAVEYWRVRDALAAIGC